MPSTFYLDYDLGNDANDGSSWALAWKTITAGATAARIAPGDTIRIAKSPAPVALAGGTHQATWTNLSKTVTLNAAETLTVDLCETAWTANVSGDATVTRTAVATDGKEGSYCMKIAMDAAPQAGIMQAYFATGTLDLHTYQKISFWIKNEAAIADATTWTITLCSDNAGATPVDTFVIPAIPSTARWIPLTIARTGGGNLGAAIESIAINTGATAPTASKYVYIDNFIACTTNGLNLQSLISKNSAEQGGAEGWYGIQSINGVTVLLDNDTNTKGNAGRGYSTTGTSPETVNTYKRETIKTALAASSPTSVQAVQESGTAAGGNESYQGGYDTSTNEQTGETFFDGLNGNGYGIDTNYKSYNTFNYLCVCRYYTGIYLNSSANNTITTLSNANNNTMYGVCFYYSSHHNIITTLSNANNNAYYGVDFYNSCNNIITTLSNANSNYGPYGGVTFSASHNNTITMLSNANNNSYGVYFDNSFNNTIKNLATRNNTSRGVQADRGTNYIRNWNASESTEAYVGPAYGDLRIYSWCHDKPDSGYENNHWIWTDGGTIHSTTTVGKVHEGTIAWHFTPDSTRVLAYPLTMKLAEIAVVANETVTVKVWVKKDHGTNVEGKLCIKGGFLTGVATDQFSSDVGNTTDYTEMTVTALPTEKGVLTLEAWAWYVAGASQVYFDGTVTVTQA